MKNMKKLKLSLLFLSILSVGMTFQSCDDDDEYYYYYPINRPNAVVTVKPETADSKFFLQLDDSTTLTPLNMRTSPYGDKEVEHSSTSATPNSRTTNATSMFT